MPEGSDLVFNRLNAHYRKTGKIMESCRLATELHGCCTKTDIVDGIRRFDKQLDAYHALERI